MVLPLYYSHYIQVQPTALPTLTTHHRAHAYPRAQHPVPQSNPTTPSPLLPLQPLQLLHPHPIQVSRANAVFEQQLGLRLQVSTLVINQGGGGGAVLTCTHVVLCTAVSLTGRQRPQVSYTRPLPCT